MNFPSHYQSFKFGHEFSQRLGNLYNRLTVKLQRIDNSIRRINRLYDLNGN